jgi:hypothetical protein
LDSEPIAFVTSPQGVASAAIYGRVVVHLPGSGNIVGFATLLPAFDSDIDNQVMPPDQERRRFRRVRT